MTRELRQKTKIQLALAIAQGRSVALWARDSQVARSTAYRWASQPEVRAAAESCRRRAQNGALGRMASRAYWASCEVASLAESAGSESVRLRALRSIFSGAIAMSKLAVLKRHMSGKGVSNVLCQAPVGPFRQKVPDPFSNRGPVVPGGAMFTSGHVL